MNEQKEPHKIQLPSFPEKPTSLKMQRHAPFLRTQTSELSVFVFSEHRGEHSRFCGIFGLYCNYSIFVTQVVNRLRQYIITTKEQNQGGL